MHRVLKASLQHRLSPTLKERLRADFPGLAEISSQREKLAEEAERDLTRYYHSKWASERCGEVFEGVISGVNNFGLFVALRNAVEGLVHISNLDDDYYLFLEDALTLLGRNTKKRYRLGDRIEVTNNKSHEQCPRKAGTLQECCSKPFALSQNWRVSVASTTERRKKQL